MFPNSVIAQIKPMADTYKMLSTSVSPGEALEKIALDNYGVRQAMDQARAMNNNPKSAFYAEARRRGLSDIEIENGLKNLSQTLGINVPN